MYRFYECADVCFAYLRDVSIDSYEETFVKSEWFTRGWTLQELLAPAYMKFYDRDWNLLGTKQSLSHLIFAATGIQEDVIDRRRGLRDCSVAQRMSWAAKRETTRIEDRAYSLLGIFGVNMTMLYGEGSKSFLRLQEEVLKTLDDHSIFVWRGFSWGMPGLLASSAKAFASSGNVRNIRDEKGTPSYTVNNRGVHGQVQLYPYTLDTYLMLLPCDRRNPSTPWSTSGRIGIFLRRLYADDQFMRVSVDGIDLMDDVSAYVFEQGRQFNRTCIERSISIRQIELSTREQSAAYAERIQGFRLNEDLLKNYDSSIPLFSEGGNWHPQTRIVWLPPGATHFHRVGGIDISAQEKEIQIISFGFDTDYNPTVSLSHTSSRYYEDTWSTYDQSADGSRIAWMTTPGEGHWALKADRLDGLDVWLVRQYSAAAVPIEPVRIGRVRLRRARIDYFLVWDLHIGDLAPERKEMKSVGQAKDNSLRYF